MYEQIFFKTLTIFDWDDTLYPTFSYLLDDNVDYDLIDNKIYSLFCVILEYSDIIIITDAIGKWVEMTLDKFPLTKMLIEDRKIKILSTYDIYVEYELTYKKKLSRGNRKIKVFQTLINLFNDFNNIISVGDSTKEYEAMIKMFRKDRKKRFFKNIKLFKHPNSELILEQLKLLKSEYFYIYSAYENKDLLIQIDL